MTLRIASMAVLTTLLVSAQPLRASAQVAPRDPGDRLPASVLERKARDVEAYTFGRAWKQRAARARARELPFGQRAAQTSQGVTGHFEIPVFAVRFSDTGADPWPVSDLESSLFEPAGATLSSFYREISGQRIDVDGTVRGWYGLPETASYYEGTSSGTNPSNARIGELISNTLANWDSGVDFGMYDNDGPDGIPNSGDDDGYVDFVAFVHPKSGAECGGGVSSIWSHRWRYSAWAASGGAPYVTGDVSASGGQILIDDYTIQPGLACDGMNRIEIGVFCHEFGHAFGLPDLYDVNGGAEGLGHWGLMASGNWNTPSSPSHMSAWSKEQLGWANVVDVDWQGTILDIGPVEDSDTIYRLATYEDRWRRRNECALSGNWSMAVGLDDAQSAARGWPASSGYGNGWVETVARDFDYDGSGPVSLEYDYGVHTEAGFDFVFVVLQQAGVESTLAIYDGQNGGMAQFDLEGYLSPGPYRVGFRLRSDSGWSNEDGKYVSACAAFAVDNLRVSGGGESYFSDFEDNRGGWFQPRTEADNPLTEYWLVENRQAEGFDTGLHGTGLMVYHVDNDVMGSSLQNSGGSNNLATRGVVVEEADGQFDLLDGAGNRGDGGDVWPGVASNMVFDCLTAPSALNNSGRDTGTRVEVLAVNGLNVQVRMSAGDAAPQIAGVSPDTLSGGSGTVSLAGATGLQPGVQARLVMTGQPDIVATDVEWIDYDLALATFDISGQAAGSWDLVVENPDGQTDVQAAAIFRAPSATDAPSIGRLPERFALSQNFPNPFNPATTIHYDVPQEGRVDLAVFDLRGRRIATLYRGTIDAGSHEARWEGRDDEGRSVASGLYFVHLTGRGFSESRKMMLAK